jgi:hypothetical protein
MAAYPGLPHQFHVVPLNGSTLEVILVSMISVGAETKRLDMNPLAHLVVLAILVRTYNII